MKTPATTSRKFYEDINTRISQSVKVIGGSDELLVEMKAAVDIYLAEGTAPRGVHNGGNPLVVMVFALLKPEIDKAIVRSRKARERGLRRKKSPTSRELTQMLAEAPLEDYEAVMKEIIRERTGDSEADVHLNRSERRRIEQMRRRDKKRLAKINARMSAGQGCNTSC